MRLKKTTLRQQVQDILKKELVEKYRPGDLLPGERILSERFEVSILTVREAVQGLVDLGLVERRQGVGTTVLSQKEARANLPVGILVEIDVSHPNTSPNYLTQAMGLKRELERRGHSSRMFFGSLRPGDVSAEPACPEFLQALEENSLKGVIAVSCTSMAWKARFDAMRVPVVSIGDDGKWRVRTDFKNFITRALSELIDGGCRRLALMTWEGRDQKRASDRSELFRAQLEQAGLPASGRWIFSGVEPSLSGAGWEAMREIWSAENERPDGLIITDDMLLRGALLAVRELRIQVPNQLKIAALVVPGHTNPGVTPLSTYEIDIDEIISNLVDLLEGALAEHQMPAREITLPARRRVTDVVLDESAVRSPSEQVVIP